MFGFHGFFQSVYCIQVFDVVISRGLCRIQVFDVVVSRGQSGQE